MGDERWPALPYTGWKDTYETLHMWMQVVGKVAVATSPPLNHTWGSAFKVTTNGLTSGVLSHGGRAFQMAFDFRRHMFTIETGDGQARELGLSPRSVASFYAHVMATLRALDLPIRIWSTPVEIPTPVPFEEDTLHASYEPEAVERFWRILVEVERVLTAERCAFVGKASPANFYWGSCDLALTRFSGRTAPPREGPAFMRDAYSHEVISHGFWPGNEQMPEPVFYAYAVPEPEGLRGAAVEPPAAYYHQALGEFVLPYEAVRTASSPADALAAFIRSTYTQAATLADWNRQALDRPAPSDRVV